MTDEGQLNSLQCYSIRLEKEKKKAKQRAAEEKERQVASVMAEAVEGPVGAQVTAGSWKRGWRGSATCSG